MSSLCRISDSMTTENPMDIGFSLKQGSLRLLDLVRSIDADSADAVECEQTLSTLNLLSLEIVNPLENLKTLKVEIYLLMGRFLNRMKPIEGGKGIITHGEWDPLLKRLGLSSSQSENMRWASVLFPTYVDARNDKITCVEDLKRAVTAHRAKLQGSPPVEPKQPNPQASLKGWRITMLEAALKPLMDKIPTAVDLLDDPALSLKILDEVRQAFNEVVDKATEMVRAEQVLIAATFARGKRASAVG